MNKILISGGSGLVGSTVTNLLIQKGYQVEHLSRSKNSKGNVRVRLWDIKKGWIEEGAFENLLGIIHLAGAGIASVKHNEQGKKVLTDSRVNSAELLFQKLSSLNIKPEFFISASAVGYYGMETNDSICEETDDSGSDFVSELCVKWEAKADQFKSICRVAKVRIGLVLDKDEGALNAISMPTQFGLGAALGSGKQWLPWIHKKDLARLFLYLIENKLEGVFNGVAPKHINNKDFTKAVAKAYGVPAFLPGIPSGMLKLFLGEKATLVLEGKRVSSQKVLSTGFEFKYPDLNSALGEIYGS